MRTPPRTVTRPESGSSRPASMASRLVLPSPFRPTTPTRSPSFRPRVTESKTTFVGNWRCRASAPRRCAISLSRLGHQPTPAPPPADPGAVLSRLRRTGPAACGAGRQAPRAGPVRAGTAARARVRAGRRRPRPRPSGRARERVTSTPRRSRGSGSRETRPAAASRSIRLVIVPEVTRVARSSAPGVSWNGGPARRSADSTSNSQDSRPWAAKAPRRAMSRCLASRETRLRTWSGPTSRSGRCCRHAATRSSTSSRSLPESCPIGLAYLLTSRCLIIHDYLDMKILYIKVICERAEPCGMRDSTCGSAVSGRGRSLT